MAVEQHRYRRRSEILSTREGLAAGLLGSLVLIGVAGLIFAARGQSAWLPLDAAADFWLRGPLSPAALWLGLAVVLFTGGLLGMLYASAQERLDLPSLLLVAVYYGFVTWMGATVLVLSWLSPATRAIWQSWPVLAGHLAYGLTLGLWAARRLMQTSKT
ncbi:MAG: DUF6789 family protein [Caldilineales bacterium]